MEQEAAASAAFDFQGEPVNVVRLPRSWRVSVGARTAERRSLDEALTELLGHSREVLRLQVEILEWTSTAGGSS